MPEPWIEHGTSRKHQFFSLLLSQLSYSGGAKFRNYVKYVSTINSKTKLAVYPRLEVNAWRTGRDCRSPRCRKYIGNDRRSLLCKETSDIFESNILKASKKRNTIQTVLCRGLSIERSLPKRPIYDMKKVLR